MGLLTKEQANYRLPDKCCLYCIHSKFDKFGDAACPLLETVMKPFPNVQDNAITLGAVCDLFEVMPISEHEEVQAQRVAMVGEEAESSEILQEQKVMPCKHSGKGICDELCEGCTDYEGEEL